ncbi:MAG: hypothetical protein ABW124_17340 [Candidatus Thiodiazotropha sp. 6PLUC9]
MNRLFILILGTLFVTTSSIANDFSNVSLSKEQCEEWKAIEYIQLSDDNKQVVIDSCKQRYTSERALGNCTAFEGEDLIKYLKNKAKTECQ